jgi:hypothetical protein
MPYCQYCGKTMNRDARFCKACGAPTVQSSSQPQPPVAYPVQQEPPVYYPPEPQQYRPRKTMSAGAKILIGFGTTFFVLVLVVVLVAGYFGLVPGVSSLMGANKPVNLGTKYTAQDYNNAIAKSGVQYQGGLTAAWVDKSQLSFGPPVAMSNDFSASEVMARMNEYPQPDGYPVENWQVRFNKDGTTEVSGVFRWDRLGEYAQSKGYSAEEAQEAMEFIDKYVKLPREMPFYVKGTGGINNGVPDFDLVSLKIGRLPVPLDSLSESQSGLIDYFYERVEGVPGLKINNARVVNGKLHVDGMVPSTIKLKQ